MFQYKSLYILSFQYIDNRNNFQIIISQFALCSNLLALIGLVAKPENKAENMSA